MAMSAGLEPTVWNSVLTGFSLSIRNNLIAGGLQLGDDRQEQIIGDTTYQEDETNWHNRVLSEKKFAYSLAKSTIDEITNNMQIDVYNSFLTGVPAPGDGGTALKTQWSLSSNILTGPTQIK